MLAIGNRVARGWSLPPTFGARCVDVHSCRCKAPRFSLRHHARPVTTREGRLCGYLLAAVATMFDMLPWVGHLGLSEHPSPPIQQPDHVTTTRRVSLGQLSSLTSFSIAPVPSWPCRHRHMYTGLSYKYIPQNKRYSRDTATITGEPQS